MPRRDKKMWTLRKLITTLFVVGSLLILSSPAAAEETISVEVRVIAASTDGDSFDRQLSDLRGRLERGFAGYSSFRQLDHQTLRLGRNQTGTVELPTDNTLSLQYQGAAGDFVNLRLSIGDRLNTTLRATPGSTFFQAGLNYDGGILILAITVR